MQKKTKEYRQEIAENFINLLKEKELDWKKEWKGKTGTPLNARSNKRYRGINAFNLRLTMLSRGYEDPRWATYHQIQEKGWKLNNAKGQGVRVEYWFPYDREERKQLSWKEFRELADGKPSERYILKAWYSTVFNADLIEGIPEYEVPINENVSTDVLIDKLSDNMGVEIINTESDRAYYRPSEDKIYLPEPGFFNSTYAYNSTALHELAHSTGAPHRLNRDMSGGFGSQSYAYEELIAEITSCFVSENLQIEQDIHHIENHKAYVQSWITAITKKPETLIKAVAEAEKTAAYMEYHAELISKEEYVQAVQSSVEVKDNQPLQKKQMEERSPRI